MAVSLLSLPNELLLYLGEMLPDSALYSLVLTNRHLSELLNPVLWKFGANNVESSFEGILPFPSESNVSFAMDLLVYAVGTNNRAMVQKIMQFGELDYETYPENMGEALRTAVEQRAGDWIELLLTVVEKQHCTYDEDALHRAVESAIDVQDSTITARLLRHGKITRRAWSHECRRVLQLDNPDLLRVLLDHVQPTTREINDLFLVAAKVENLPAMELLLERGAEIDYRQLPYGATCLHMAALAGNMRLLQWLLDHGANVNAPGREGETAVYDGAHHLPVLQLLVRHGADVTSREILGYAPLLKAACAAKLDCFKYILSLQVGPIDNYRFPLDDIEFCIRALAWAKSERMICFILDRLDLNQVGERILFHGQSHCKIPLLKILVDKGVSLGARHHSQTLLHHYAASWMDSQITWSGPVRAATEFIVDRRPEGVFEVDDEGNTPLHLAVVVGNMGVVRTLLEHGALPLAVNKKGETPLDRAQSAYRQEVVSMLNTYIRDSKAPVSH